MFFFSHYSYLFWIRERNWKFAYLILKDLVEEGSKVLSSTARPGHMILDYLNKRVIILSWKGVIVSMDYDSQNRVEIFSDRSIGQFSQIGSSMYWRKNIFSPVIVEMNATSRNISRYIRFTGDDVMRLLVVDRSLQPGGSFYMSNIYIYTYT